MRHQFFDCADLSPSRKDVVPDRAIVPSVGQQIITVHAYAIVGNGKALGFFINCDFDFEIGIVGCQLGIREGFITQFVTRI